LQVLEHHHGTVLAADQVADQVDRGAQQLLSGQVALVGGGQVGQDRGEQHAQGVPAGAERLGDGGPAAQVRLGGLQQELVGPAHGALLGLPGEHRRAVGQAEDQLAQQAGLADARLAADERDLRVGDGGEQAPEPLQLTASSDHHRAEPRPRNQHPVTVASGDRSACAAGPGRRAVQPRGGVLWAMGGGAARLRPQRAGARRGRSRRRGQCRRCTASRLLLVSVSTGFHEDARLR